MQQLIEDFLEARSAAEAWDIKTFNYHQARLRPFCQFLAGRGIVKPADIRRYDVERYLADLKIAKLSWSTRNGTYTSINLFFDWLWENGLVTGSPFDGPKPIKRPRKETHIQEPVPEAAYRAMIEVARLEDSLFARRDEAMMRILLNTGMRRKELVSLRLKDWDPTSRKLSIKKGGKYNKQRPVFIYPATAQALDAWIAVRPKTPAATLFVTLHTHKRGKYTPMEPDAVNEVMAKWRTKAGLSPWSAVSPHKWRHRFGTDFSARGGDILILQPLMGHSDIRITREYVNHNEEILRRKADEFSPGDDLDADVANLMQAVEG